MQLKIIRSLVVLCHCLFFLKAKAQLCSGSLGDPVANITFGNGAVQGPPLEPSITNYNYVAADCPNDGQYTIRSSTANCYSAWHTLTADHTGEAQGYFMMVNASFEPSDFYVKKVSGICANTTYEFAAWMMNLVRRTGQIKPNITFSIEALDGTVLGSFSTGDIDVTNSPQWRQYGFNFKTPPGTFDVLLRMRNNAPGGIGNDIALDDITFRPCGPLLKTSFSGSADTLQLCEVNNDTFNISAVVPPFFSNPLYQWQVSRDKGTTWTDIAGANTLAVTVSPTEKGFHWYRISVAEKENFSLATCRIASSISAVHIHSAPIVYAGADKVIIKSGNSTLLNGSVSDASATYSWQPGIYLSNDSALSPVASPPSDQTYNLSATSQYGCSASDEVFVKVISGIYFPNAFSPNGDGINDNWRIPYAAHLPGATVKIFNRYGSLIYQTQKGEDVDWDGTYNGVQQPVGTYVYLVQVETGGVYQKGTITLFR